MSLLHVPSAAVPTQRYRAGDNRGLWGQTSWQPTKHSWQKFPGFRIPPALQPTLLSEHPIIFYDVKVKLGDVGWDLFSERISGDFFLSFLKWILCPGLSLCCRCFTDTVHCCPTKAQHQSTKHSLITRTVPAPKPLMWASVCTTNRAHDEQTRAGNTTKCYRLLMLVNRSTPSLRLVYLSSE